MYAHRLSNVVERHTQLHRRGEALRNFTGVGTQDVEPNHAVAVGFVTNELYVALVVLTLRADRLLQRSVIGVVDLDVALNMGCGVIRV